MSENDFEENKIEIKDINVVSEDLTETEPQPEKPADETSDVKEETEKSMASEVFEWVQAIAVAVVLALFLRTFVFTLVNVKGSSMVPTLHNSERLVVWRLGYTPKTGDIMVFRPRNTPKEPYIKRVIATEGQTVDIKKNNSGTCDVYVDGKKLDESYIAEPIAVTNMGDHKYPLVVPQGHIFAMGDNRNHSLDSRFKTVDVVDTDSIVGHAVWRFWPFNAVNVLTDE